MPFTKETADDALAIGTVERDLVRALAVGEDAALLDEAAAVSGGRPASILSGLSPVADSTAASIEGDVVALLEAVRAGEPEAPYFVASASGALWLARQRASGAAIFPNVGVRGGDLLGVPLVISAGAQHRLVLVDAAAVWHSEAGLAIDPAGQTALQFRDDPQTGPQNLVSLWQTNCLALRAVFYVGWQRGTDDAAAFIELPAGSPA